MLQRERVMFTQALYIAHLEATRLGYVQSRADRQQLSIGEYVALIEDRVRLWMGGDAGDPMIEEDAARTQQLPGLLKVRRQQ